MSPSEVEMEMLERQALICQALSDPKRLRILYALGPTEHSPERSVGDLASELGVSIANVSQHLGVLRSRGLVDSRREGTSVFYRLAYPETMEACRVLRSIIARQLADEGRLSERLRHSG